MEDFESELKRFFEYTNTHKISELAVALGVSATTIRTWRTRNKIPENIYRKMELSLKNGDNSEEVSLPFYDLEAIKESSSLDGNDKKVKLISINKLLLPSNLNINLSDTFITEVKGDSMEPTIKKGAIIMVDQEEKELSDGIYLFNISGNILVRRLHFTLSEGMHIISDNDFYPNHIEYEEDNFKAGIGLNVIGRVIWCGQNT